jgi:anti-anti-sigma factor
MGVFSVRTAESAGLRIVRVSGDCDMSVSDELTAALIDAVNSSPQVEIDLAAVDFLDSSGIHALVTAYHRAVANGGTLRVTHAVGVVASVLELTGIAQLLSAPVREGDRR